MEIWKDIKGFSDYRVSNMGRIISNKGKHPKILKQCLSGSDRIKYNSVMICKNGRPYPKKVHVLVARAFIGPRPKGYQTSHINEDRYDNRSVNLCYESISDNNSRPKGIMRKMLSRPIGEYGYRGIYRTRHGTWEAEIIIAGRRFRLGTYRDIRDAAKAYDKKAVEARGVYAVTNKRLGLL